MGGAANSHERVAGTISDVLFVDRRSTAAFFAAAGAILSACHHQHAARLPEAGASSAAVVATSDIPPTAVFPLLRGARFGGVSSLAYDEARDELFGLSDDPQNSRVFRLRAFEDPFRVEPIGFIPLEHAAAGPSRLRPEGLAVLPSGHLLIASPGAIEAQQRVPPGIFEYTRKGRFVRRLPVPPEFLAPILESAPRDDVHRQGFVALALTPDHRTLWTAVGTSLAQDGPAATVEHGARVRLLVYRVEKTGEFVPDREFAYEVDPVPQTPVREARVAISWLVDLLALGDRDFIAVERAYVEDAENAHGHINRIRLYRMTIDGTVIEPGQASIAGTSGIAPVSKSLLLDLGATPNLPQDLFGLEDFEGLVAMPSRIKGRAFAILASDDDFEAPRRTWFLKLGFGPVPIP